MITFCKVLLGYFILLLICNIAVYILIKTKRLNKNLYTLFYVISKCSFIFEIIPMIIHEFGHYMYAKMNSKAMKVYDVTIGHKQGSVDWITTEFTESKHYSRMAISGIIFEILFLISLVVVLKIFSFIGVVIFVNFVLFLIYFLAFKNSLGALVVSLLNLLVTVYLIFENSETLLNYLAIFYIVSSAFTILTSVIVFTELELYYLDGNYSSGTDCEQYAKAKSISFEKSKNIFNIYGTVGLSISISILYFI